MICFAGGLIYEQAPPRVVYPTNKDVEGAGANEMKPLTNEEEPEDVSSV